MIFRVVRAPTSLTMPAASTLRPPGNVPYLIDNLWEWLRPEAFASRRTAAFASPTAELAAACASGSVEDAWNVELLDGQTAFQIAAGANPEDARYHKDVRGLARLIMRDSLGAAWLERPAHQRGPEAVLFLPCATRSEVGDAIDASQVLDADKIRSASTFWTDVIAFDDASNPPHPAGEIFFGGSYRLAPLNT